MAGIGFVLRKLAKKEDLVSILDSFVRASIIMAGPWLMTVVVIGIAMFFGKILLPPADALNFQSIIIYNFCFSLVLSAPFTITETRNLADQIYSKDVSRVPGMLYGTLVILYSFQIPLSVLFYFGYANLSFYEAFLAVANYLLISTLWMGTIYLTALFDYQSVTRGFGIGMFVAAILTVLGALFLSDTFMLFGFNVGLSVIIVFFLTSILAEYPYPFKEPYSFIEGFKKYKEVAYSGLIYNAAIWVDKWIMWFSPEGRVLENGLVVNPPYDFAAFLAYFTTIPTLALFLIDVETRFFEKYLRFFDSIREGATLKQIVSNQNDLELSLVSQFSGLLLLQGLVAMITILAAPKIFQFFNINFSTLEMFRYCIVGASYQVFILFLTIILWYFDSRRRALIVHLLFFISNALLTGIFLQLGPKFYGMGFAFSSMLSFCVAAIFTFLQVKNLPYHTFITNNTSVRK